MTYKNYVRSSPCDILKLGTAAALDMKTSYNVTQERQSWTGMNHRWLEIAAKASLGKRMLGCGLLCNSRCTGLRLLSVEAHTSHVFFIFKFVYVCVYAYK